MVRAESLPSPLGYLSILGAVAALLPVLGFVGFVLVLPLWTIATTIWLLRRNRSEGKGKRSGQPAAVPPD